jgi:hypothetical protein
VSQHAFSCSTRTPQTGLAPPLRRTPPGQKDGALARLIPGYRTGPGFGVVLSISALDQRFALARLPDPHLTHHLRLFPDRSPRRSSANAARGGLEPPTAGRLRGATKPSSSVQHRSGMIYCMITPSRFRTHALALILLRVGLRILVLGTFDFASGSLPCESLGGRRGGQCVCFARGARALWWPTKSQSPAARPGGRPRWPPLENRERSAIGDGDRHRCGALGGISQ